MALAGRTDAGVHARGQVASFLTASHLDTATFVAALNHCLPEDISVQAAAVVPLAFDVRRHALSRCYRYSIHNGGQRPALARRFVWHVRAPLDVAAMQQAACCLLGEHDFAAFTQPSLAARRSTVRIVHQAQVSRRGRKVYIVMEASSFLPQQVRRTVGALVQVGSGKLSIEGFCDLVRSPRPGAAAFAAPPQGLCLLRVRYQADPFGCEDDWDEDL